MSDQFPGGVEFYTIENGDGVTSDWEQCARCGSSVFDLRGKDRDYWEFPFCYSCMSSREWCEANPLIGREDVEGAWRG
jgi:ribosomal protein S27AE